MNQVQWRRWLIYFPPVIFLVVSIGVMAGGGFLKQPLGEDDRLFESIQRVEAQVKQKEWDGAKSQLDYAHKAWHKVVNRIQFSVEREHMFEISGTIARIKGGIEAEDDKAVLEEIYFFYDLWENLGS